jgi:predicted transcriptional regulator
MRKLTNNIRVNLDDKTRLLLETEANSRHLTLSDIVRDAIYAYIEQKQREADHASETLADRQGF